MAKGKPNRLARVLGASVAVLVRLFRKWEKRYQKPGGSAVY